MKKFQANLIKFYLDERVAKSQDEGTRATLLTQMGQRLGYGQKKLTRMLSNADRTTVDELVAASQVLEVPIDDLVKLQDVEPQPA